MDSIRAYIFSVTAAAVLCAIVRTLSTGRGVGWAVELVTGLVLTTVVMAPLADLELPDLDEFSGALLSEGEAAVRYGEQVALETETGIITQRLEAYILEKASELDMTLAVEVTVDEQGLPSGVICKGVVPAGSRAALSAIITEELGISEEAQVWIHSE